MNATNSIYRTSNGKKIIQEIYDKHLEKLNLNYEDKYVDTRYGDTHVLLTGKRDGTPLVTMHGGNAYTPDGLQNILSLADRFYIYAIDTIGQPGKSAETRLPANDLSYGYWLLDVLEALNLEKNDILCGSFSAGIALRLATVAPEKINKLLMVVPSGIANGSPVQQLQLLFPYFRYRFRPTRQNLIKLVSTIIMNLYELRLEFLEAQFRHYKSTTKMPRPVRSNELVDFTAPVMIFCTDGDIMFPAKKVLPRAKKIIPNLIHSEIVDGLHEPSSESFEYIIARAIKFFSESS
ncbi:MAG: alpha/beta fold hydrolase [Candidatus Hodarchaeales archaeon]|jgi:pimeloyl-ACP methyl ester carboxylesterase